MKTKLIIAAVVLALLAVGLYLARPQETVSPTEQTQTTEVASSTEQNSATTTTTPSTNEQPVTQPTTPVATPAKSTPVQTAPLPFTATVIYTGTRFVPEEVVIIEGGTVRFANQSSEQMWIATDNHPTHDRYPVKKATSCSGNAFDQCASVGTGSSWTFAFTETGTWGFHNHVRAQDSAKVVVMTKEAYIKKYR